MLVLHVITIMNNRGIFSHTFLISLFEVQIRGRTPINFSSIIKEIKLIKIQGIQPQDVTRMTLMRLLPAVPASLPPSLTPSLPPSLSDIAGVIAVVSAN